MLLLGLSVASRGNEKAKLYFPSTVGSTWEYVDQDGNKLTRYAIEEKDIDGVTYRAFTYQPVLDDWENYQYSMQPFLYQIGEEWIAFHVSNEIETATKSILNKQLDEIIASMRLLFTSQLPPGVSIDFDYKVEPTAQKFFYLFPMPFTYNKEWLAMQIDVKVKMTMDIKGAPVDPPEDLKSTVFQIKIFETGKVIEKETIKTDAGTFKDCLRVEYKKHTSTDASLPAEIQQLLPEQESQESTTTIWLAPNVGIVKFKKSKRNPKKIISLELKDYEIKPELTDKKSID